MGLGATQGCSHSCHSRSSGTGNTTEFTGKNRKEMSKTHGNYVGNTKRVCNRQEKIKELEKNSKKTPGGEGPLEGILERATKERQLPQTERLVTRKIHQVPVGKIIPRGREVKLVFRVGRIS